MRRARSPMVRQRPLTFCSIALLLVVSACSPQFSLADKQHAPEQVNKEASFQAAKQFIAAVSAPAPSIDLVAIAPAPVDLAADVAEAPAPAGPQLPGISFLGLPAVPLPYKDYSAQAPAETSAQAPSPEKASGESTVKSFLESFVNEALPPIAKPLAGAAVSGAPLPSFGQVLASATQAIPAEAPAPAASLRVANPAGTSLVNVPFPNVQNVFSVLEKLGRRRLAQDVPEGAEPLPAMPLAAEAPMAAPGGLPGPIFQALPEPVPLPPLPRPAPALQAAMPDEAMAAMTPMAAPAGEGSAQLQARPDEGHHHHMSYMGTNSGRRLQQGPPGTVPEDIASAEPDAAMTPMAAPGGLPGPTFQALPEPAPLPPLPRPAPQLQTMPAEAMAAMAPMSAMAGEAQPGAQYQARPAEAHRKNAYFGTITRHLLQGPPGTVPEDIASAEPDAAMSPMAAPGGLPGPIFQALPEPAPLPPLPRPAPQLQTMPAEAMAAMAPMSAMAGEAQPGAQYQARPAEDHRKNAYFGTITRRHLLQGPPGTVPEGVEATEPDAAMTPMSAPGALPQPGPVFQALPEPAPLPPLPRPAPQLQAAMPDEASSMAAMTPMAAPAGEASAQYQARPAEAHRKNAYFGTITRHLLQGPSDGPPGTVPEDDVEISDTQSDAAYAPMSAMSGMPQPGPQFQALPQPGPLPVLPRPADAPEGAPAGEAQPGVSLEAKTPKNAAAKAEAKANANPKGENHVNPPAKVATASTATAAAAVTNVKTTAGRRLQATAPAPAPEQSMAARRDMPPLPPVMPGMTAGAQPPQPAQGAPQGVGVFQADDPNSSESPALQVPKEYETGLINAFKQAIPQYISNALAMSG